MEKKNIPLYRIVIDKEDESGVFAVALVDEPAIERDFIKLAKQVKQEIKFSADKDKQVLYGPLLIPNKMIYRRDPNGNEFNITFEEETIELIAEKYNKNRLGNIFNFQHTDVEVEAFMLENWLIENPDKSEKYGFSDLPEGTWFAKVKVEDKEFWDKYVKGEEVKGFSVELAADVEEVKLSKNNNDNNKNEEMEKNTEEVKLANVMTTDGVAVYYSGDFVVGAEVFIDEAMTEPAPEGEHELEGGIKITVEEGKVSEIVEIEEEESEEEETEELSEETEETEESTEELEGDEPSFEEKVLSIVQPLLDKVNEQTSELLNKFADVESKLSENAEAKTEMNELKSQIEKLSKTAGADSITKKDDSKKAKKEEKLSEMIQNFRKLR